MYIVIVILFSFCINLSVSQLCPPSEDVFPCKCTERRVFYSKNSLSGSCAGLASLDQLKNSIQGFHGTNLDMLSIQKSSFDYIPYDLFKNMTIRHLEITKSNFSRIGNLGDPQFQGLENSLESLSISSSFTRLNPFAYVNMGHLQKLSSVQLMDNHVEVFHNEWFKYGPTSLEIVRFAKGNIRAVGYKALQALPKLKTVDLSENDIHYIPRSGFPQPANFLEELYLERNKMDHLPKDFFTEMPRLRIVNLELNEFSTIDQSLWEPVWRDIRHIIIDYNPLVCDEEIKWIYKSKENLERKLIATCYKPFHLMDRELHSLKEDEIK